MTSFERLMDLLTSPIQDYIEYYHSSIEFAKLEDEQIAAAQAARKSPPMTNVRRTVSGSEQSDSVSLGTSDENAWSLSMFLASAANIRTPGRRPVTNHRLKRDKLKAAGIFLDVIKGINEVQLAPEVDAYDARFASLIDSAEKQLKYLTETVLIRHKEDIPGHYDKLVVVFKNMLAWLRGPENIDRFCRVHRFETSKLYMGASTGSLPSKLPKEHKEHKESKAPKTPNQPEFKPEDSTIELIAYLFQQVLELKVNEFACDNGTLLESERLLPKTSVINLINAFSVKIKEIDDSERGVGDKPTYMITALKALQQTATDVQDALEAERLSLGGYMPNLIKNNFVPRLVSAPNPYMEKLIAVFTEKAELAESIKQDIEDKKRESALML